MPTAPTPASPRVSLMGRLLLSLLGAKWELRLECGPKGTVVHTWYLVNKTQPASLPGAQP